MQQFNMWAVNAIAALIPMIIGAIWYAKPVFGKAWMRTNNFRDDDVKPSNIALKYLLAYVLAYMICIPLSALVIHQMGTASMVMDSLMKGDVNTKTWLSDAMAKYGNNFRTFKHGALHGTIAGLFIAMPVIGTIAIFERRSFKYVAIHAGYWIVSLALMGGFICQFTQLAFK